ncbi:hypothetical protein MKW92_032998, partial [Papaver armeniacum]
DDELSEEEQQNEPSGNIPGKSNHHTDIKPLESSSLDAKKREKKEMLAAEAATQGKERGFQG